MFVKRAPCPVPIVSISVKSNERLRSVSFACGNLGKREEYHKDISVIEADGYRGIPEVWR